MVKRAPLNTALSVFLSSRTPIATDKRRYRPLATDLFSYFPEIDLKIRKISF